MGADDEPESAEAPPLESGPTSSQSVLIPEPMNAHGLHAPSEPILQPDTKPMGATIKNAHDAIAHRSPRMAASEAAMKLSASFAPSRLSTAGDGNAVTGPVGCERCTKLGKLPKLQCFAQVAERCRASAGVSASAPRWHHISEHEHFCHDCVEFYGRGDGRRIWQTHQLHAKCSFKELVIKLHLPCWVRCARKDCSRWRALPARTRPWELSNTLECSDVRAI